MASYRESAETYKRPDFESTYRDAIKGRLMTVPYHCVMAAILAASLPENARTLAFPALVLRILNELTDIQLIRGIKEAVDAYKSSDDISLISAGTEPALTHYGLIWIFLNQLMTLGPIVFTEYPSTPLSATDLLIGGAVLADATFGLAVSRCISRERMRDLVTLGKDAMLHGKKAVGSLGGNQKK